MEDELSEARLEASKLKTELVSEKSAWEVKMSEMQSKVNAVRQYLYIAHLRPELMFLVAKDNYHGVKLPCLA